MLLAVIHVAGSLLALIAFWFLVLFISSRDVERQQKNRREEIAIELGVAVDDLEDESLSPRILKLASERYSSELLSNRLSDFCGAISTLWSWLSLLLQVGVLLGIIWSAATEYVGDAVYSWSVLLIGVFFWITAVIFARICRLFTGRYPGEAKRGRKLVAEPGHK